MKVCVLPCARACMSIRFRNRMCECVHVLYFPFVNSHFLVNVIVLRHTHTHTLSFVLYMCSHTHSQSTENFRMKESNKKNSSKNSQFSFCSNKKRKRNNATLLLSSVCLPSLSLSHTRCLYPSHSHCASRKLPRSVYVSFFSFLTEFVSVLFSNV